MKYDVLRNEKQKEFPKLYSKTQKNEHERSAKSGTVLVKQRRLECLLIPTKTRKRASVSSLITKQ